MNNVTDTQTSEDIELLPVFEKWAALEPDRCSVSRFDDGQVFTLSLDGNAVAWYLLPSALRVMEKAVLQACLQEAIAAHGWLYKIENATDGQHYVQVLKPKNHAYFTGQHAEPATALLLAYLQALEVAA
ncbi:hypothetical protein H6F86_21100 [Phormidium sp. FACHB-592]|uniref:Uncharacterized protein n=1 Tax=Stenomitos frigidus AS-A4 TaxID=2933935 RepID=A0ABV0KF71_9CYAN|nr:hypothetical protein [Phormidium sp. FACHB-592]MBD2076333.1 hypothetical protein [Phormidium sp. FACHB-592]